ncbi:MAG: hypothetical protein K0R54_4371 [Clostridiaceae bacterium]|jgi:hypothetical protein|nr:hypothetical protein [Clostridiaceae bacterium]
MNDAIKSIMQKEHKIMEYVNSNNMNDSSKFQQLISSFSKDEIIVLECLMHAGREKYTKLELLDYNTAEELIDVYYNTIFLKEQKEFNKNIVIGRIIDKFPRLSEYFKCGFQLINDPYVSRNIK